MSKRPFLLSVLETLWHQDPDLPQREACRAAMEGLLARLTEAYNKGDVKTWKQEIEKTFPVSDKARKQFGTRGEFNDDYIRACVIYLMIKSANVPTSLTIDRSK
jgi:hypothetical protein